MNIPHEDLNNYLHQELQFSRIVCVKEDMNISCDDNLHL